MKHFFFFYFYVVLLPTPGLPQEEENIWFHLIHGLNWSRIAFVDKSLPEFIDDKKMLFDHWRPIYNIKTKSRYGIYTFELIM